MRVLKLLNKKSFYLFIFYIFLSSKLNSNEPIDIWDLDNIKQEKVELESNTLNDNKEPLPNINYSNTNLVNIEQDDKIDSIN